MGAIVFGHAHDQAGILIEPRAEYAIDVEDEDQLIKFRDLLWLVDPLVLEHLFHRSNASFLQADY